LKLIINMIQVQKYRAKPPSPYAAEAKDSMKLTQTSFNEYYQNAQAPMQDLVDSHYRQGETEVQEDDGQVLLHSKQLA